MSPDVVFVCTPSALHVPQALKAVRAGAHIFVEKPLACSAVGIDELLAEIEDRGLISMVGCNMRFHPGPRTLKKLVEEGYIGDVIASIIQAGSYLPRWRPDRDYRATYSANAEQGGGAVLDCIHEIDLALWYFGPITEVAAMVIPGTSIGIDVEGGAQILARHESGVLTSIHLNFVQHDYRRQCQVIGTRGTLYWDFDQQYVRLFDGTSQAWRRFDLPIDWSLNQMYVDELSYFLQCVGGKQGTFSDAWQGWQAVQIALAVKESDMQRRFISVNYFNQFDRKG